jgi:uncharacterized membrane protein
MAAFADGTSIQAIPPSHQGKAALAPLLRNAKGRASFEFQKENYVHEKDETGVLAFVQVSNEYACDGWSLAVA